MILRKEYILPKVATQDLLVALLDAMNYCRVDGCARDKMRFTEKVQLKKRASCSGHYLSIGFFALHGSSQCDAALENLKRR